MTDYGHELQFGSFITPTNDPPETPVTLAQLSEQVGLDLVTFQDHPYQPAFHDTWTLMAQVAAVTVQIQIAPNVANLPLRPPAVLARSAASLDLLSGGRFSLGLGAGAFWDAIEAMGGPRRTPGESIESLEEAIEIIRQLWDPSERRGVRVDGQHYRVVGAKRGPAPRHDIPIWLGGYKPRMLRLVGRKSDGWLPSYGYLQPGQLAEGNDTIDAAATRAGRSPADIRRLLNINGMITNRATGFLNGPAEQWVEELSQLALEDGISTFILATDDPRLLEAFATEVAPLVREEVERGRAVPTDRSAAVEVDDDAARGESPERALVAGRVASESFTVVPTHDDGVRLVDEQPWDEGSRPSGPAPDPDREYTAHDLASGQHLIDVHDHLRGELTQVRDLMDQVLDGTMTAAAARSHINTMTMRQNNWTFGAYCAAYCRLVTTHHSLEDQAMFPRLRQADPRLRPVIDRLEQEHDIIHDVLERVDRALVDHVRAPNAGTDLREAVDLLTDVLLSHLAYEERELVEPIARTGIL